MPREAIRSLLAAAAVAVLAATPAGAIERHPTGVNVNAQGGTSVFITFGGLADQVPVEATWCGELIPASPDIGLKCDPATLFGRLPLRFDRSRLSGGGTVFSDVMSIPPSVARRAYQAAQRGETSSFFYVRRFASLSGGPDEYVFVTCRMTGGGARTPLSLVHVELGFSVDEPVLAVARQSAPPPLAAEITYTGTGRLVGRWEVVQPGDEPPSSTDLLTEATLSPEERVRQRRYLVVGRFNVFLPPTGRIVLPGPDPSRLPTRLDGLHQVLLRIEASADKEADSDRAAAGVPGGGLIHAGAVAGFPIPPLRYFVGSANDARGAVAKQGLAILAPVAGRPLVLDRPIDVSWTQVPNVLLYRLEIAEGDGTVAHSAILQQGIGTYRTPPWLGERLDGAVALRVVALGPDGEELAATDWHRHEVGGAPAAAGKP